MKIKRKPKPKPMKFKVIEVGKDYAIVSAENLVTGEIITKKMYVGEEYK